MAGIIQKSCVVLFPLWSLKKILCFCFWGEEVEQMSINRTSQKKSKFKLDKKSC